MITMRYALTGFVIGTLHFVASIAGLFIWGGSVTERFDGRPTLAVDHLIDAAVAVLYFPFVHLSIAVPGFGGMWGYAFFVVNSAFWAAMLTYGFARLRRHQRA